MYVSPSGDFPGTYFISGIGVSSEFDAEFCDDGDIKIQIWASDVYKNLVPIADLELFYIRKNSLVWMPLLFNGRLIC